MPLIFSKCFGKKRNIAATISNVTKIRVLPQGKGDFLVKPYEDALLRAGESNSIRTLANAIEDAKKNGLLEHSEVYNAEKQRLLLWKSIESELISLCDSTDVARLAKALQKFEEQKLVDENGYYETACIIFQLRSAVNNLLDSFESEKAEPLEDAIRQYFLAKEKFDTISKQKRFVHNPLLDENDINRAKQLLADLNKENLFIQTNPDFPKQELEKAIETRDLAALRPAIRRWKRLDLDKTHPTFVSALRVQEQLVQLCRSVAIQGLEKNLKEKNSEGIRRLLTGAKDVGLPQCVISVYTNFVLKALEKQFKYATVAVKALHDEDYEKLTDIISQHSNSTSHLDEEKYHLSHKDLSDATVSSTDEVHYSDVVENAKTQYLAIAIESKNVLSAAQRVVKAFRHRKEFLATTDQHVQKIATWINTLVEDCGAKIDVRRSFRRSAKDRVVVLKNIVDMMPGFLENLTSSIHSTRASIKTFESVLRQVRDVVILWEKRNSGLPNGKEKLFESSLADFTVVHNAENVLSISQRLLSVAKVEHSLSILDELTSSSRSTTEMEHVIESIKAGLELLHSEGAEEEIHFIDLWSGASQEKTPSHNSQLLLKKSAKLFPAKFVAGLKKDAKMQLVELQLINADKEARMNSARYALKKAISTQSEGELIKALNDTSVQGLSSSDTTVIEAEKELSKIRHSKQMCRDALRVAVGKKDDNELESALLLAEDLYLAPTDPLLVSAQTELKNIRFNKSRLNGAREELEKAATASSSVFDVQLAIARAKVCQVPSCDPAFTKAKEIIDKQTFKSKPNKESHQYVIDSIRKRSDKDFFIGQSLKDNGSTKNSKQNNKNNKGNYLTSESICKYLQDEISNVKSTGPKVVSAANIQLVLDYVIKEKKDIPSHVINASLKAISIVEDLADKRSQAQKKLQLAIESNSFADLASAIASAETTQGILELSFDNSSNAFFEILAQAKENLAMQHLHRKSEEEDKVLQEMSRARRQLKKALLGEIDGSPLREAVVTFRVICTPRSNDESISNRQNSIKKIRINPTPTHVFRLDRNESKKKSRSTNGSGKFLEKSVNNANRLYRTESSQRASRNTSSLKRQSMPVGSESTSRVSRQEKQRKTFDHNNRARSARKVDKKQATETGKHANGEQSGSIEKRPSILRHRPSSAFEPRLIKTEDIGATKLAWEEIDRKNVTLLRKAEKNLKKIEKKEEKQKRYEENKELTKHIKSNLSARLKSSMKRGDRAELWQAVHEFQRYFGDEMSKEDEQLFTEAMKALASSTYIQYKNNLKAAVLERNRNKLEHVIYQIDSDEHDYMPDDEAERNQFLNDLSKARRLETNLTELQTYRDAVMTMTRSVVSEINSYPSPPLVVKSVMSATYLLLGETEKTVKDWANLHALIGKLGKVSLTRRVLRCSPEILSIGVCRLALKHIHDLSFERVHAINAGASTFYAWTKCMINEVYGRHNMEPPTSEIKQDVTLNGDKRITNVKHKTPTVDFWQRLARSHHPTPPKRTLSGIAKQTFNHNKKLRAKSAKI